MATKMTDEDWGQQLQLDHIVKESIFALQAVDPLTPKTFESETSRKPRSMTGSSSYTSLPSLKGGNAFADKRSMSGRSIHSMLLNNQPQNKRTSIEQSHHRQALQTPKLAGLKGVVSQRMLTTDGVMSREGGDTPPPETIETTAQFLKWYEQIESKLATKRDMASFQFKDDLLTKIKYCDSLLEHVDTIDDVLTEMAELSDQVIKQTKDVEEICQGLRDESNELEDVRSAVVDRLSAYTALEPIMKLFNAPGDDVCLKPKFIPYLEQIDRSISLIKSHIRDKDAEFYLMRFQKCQTRGLSLIKHYFTYTMRELGLDVSKKFNEAVEGENDLLNVRKELLYTKFGEVAESLRPRMTELQRRVKQTSDAATIFNDTQKVYFQTRRQWLHTYITEGLASIQSKYFNDEAVSSNDEKAAMEKETHSSPNAKMPSVLQEWCRFTLEIYRNERELYYAFFDKNKDTIDDPERLHDSLDDIMGLFHQQVRLIVIHEHDVAVLSGISRSLFEFVKRDSDSNDDNSSSEDDYSDAAIFYDTIDEILKDTQQRLVFRSESYIESQVNNYALTADDLNALSSCIKKISVPELDPDAKEEALAESSDSSVDINSVITVYPPYTNAMYVMKELANSGLVGDVAQSLSKDAVAACKSHITTKATKSLRDSIEAHQVHWFVKHALRRLDQDANPFVQS